MSAASIESARPPAWLRREVGLALLFLLVFLALSLGVKYFFTTGNLLRVVRDQSHLGVLAAGMTLVILTGGIDLSVGSIVALSATAMGLIWKWSGSGPLALAGAFAVGSACGAMNGLLVARGRVPPLIVTLATLSVFRGLAFALGGSNSVGGFPRAVLSWHRDNLLGLPVPFWLLLLLFVGVGIYLACTDGGRALYAVGSNESAARLSGVPVRALKFRVYLVSGLLAALAAVLYAARNDTVRADIGAEYELLAITMVVLGGVSVSGGEGSLLGAALGFLTLIYIQNGLNLMQEIRLGAMRLPVRAELHGVVVAALLVGALLMDAGFKRRARGR